MRAAVSGGYCQQSSGDPKNVLICEQAIAIEFAKANARAIVLAARTVSQLEEVKSQINSISPETQVHLQQVDVGDEAGVKSLFDSAREKFGAINVVVSNAAAQTEYGKMMVDTDTEMFWNDFVRLNNSRSHSVLC